MRSELRRTAAALFAAFTVPAGAAESTAGADGAPQLRGFVAETIAYTTADPTHWSRGVTRLQLSAEGPLGEGGRWKIGGRIDADPLIDRSSFYLDRVKRDQRADFFWRETYVDFSAGDVEFRLGAQNIVWGEVAGLFVADVVSARDLREFLLPRFDVIRLPQWAARAEYFAGDSKFEVVWIPAPTFDNIGKPGSDFYPARLPSPTPQAVADAFLDPVRPTRKLANSNYGVRLGTLIEGWDLTAFYYRGHATSPTLYRPAANVIEPRHDRLSQIGATMSKDLGSVVLRAEAVHTRGQKFSSFDPSAALGVIARRTLDWIVSGEVPFQSVDGRINLQLFKRHYFDGSAETITIDAGEFGAGVLVSAKLNPTIEPSLHWQQGFGGAGALIRPRVNWYAVRNLVVAFGGDVFSGNRNGYFGRYGNRDRIYIEARYDF